MNDSETLPVMDTYKRAAITFVRGDGAYLFCASGKRYLDFLSGIAVVGAGHGNSKIGAAIASQAATLGHVSNLFWTMPMVELASTLRKSAGGWGRVFFCNSGAEANEAAIKLARKASSPKKYKILCAEGGFHGRTFGALSATGQPSKWKGFEPLVPGFIHAPFNDLAAFESAIDSETAAVMVEPIQGERGVIPATKEFLIGLRRLCDSHSIPLIFDEIQTGMGRTGQWWAFQMYGVRPDIFTVAKGIANGLPLGACVANDTYGSVFQPGDHGTTFGGGPVVCEAARATFKFLEESDSLKNAQVRGEELRCALSKLPHVVEVRGAGLMLAVVIDSNKAKDVTAAALSIGLIVNAVSDNAIRLLPPLVLTSEQVAEGVEMLGRAIEMAC